MNYTYEQLQDLVTRQQEELDELKKENNQLKNENDRLNDLAEHFINEPIGE